MAILGLLDAPLKIETSQSQNFFFLSLLHAPTLINTKPVSPILGLSYLPPVAIQTAGAPLSAEAPCPATASAL